MDEEDMKALVMGQDSHDVPDVADAPEHEEDGGDLA